MTTRGGMRYEMPGAYRYPKWTYGADQAAIKEVEACWAVGDSRAAVLTMLDVIEVSVVTAAHQVHGAPTGHDWDFVLHQVALHYQDSAGARASRELVRAQKDCIERYARLWLHLDRHCGKRRGGYR